METTTFQCMKIRRRAVVVWENQPGVRSEVADCGRWGEFEYKSNVDRAQLFAAAPELLAALKNLLWQHDNNDGRLRGMTLQDARAAIAKTKGETS